MINKAEYTITINEADYDKLIDALYKADLGYWIEPVLPQADVIKSVCPQCKTEHTEVDCQGYCTATCLQESEGQTVL